MKKLMVMLIMTAFFATAAVAQEKNDMKMNRMEWEKKVKDELKLTADQTEKYDALNKEYNEKFETLTQDASLDKNAQKEKMMDLKKEKEAKLFEFLTPEQQAKYKELVSQKMKEMAAKKGN